MEDHIARILTNLIDRTTGPMNLRLFMQPAMAIGFAVVAGLRDAKEERAPYAWSLLSDPVHRRDMLHDGWKSVGKVFLMAMLLDAIYQYKVSGFIYPGEIAIVAFLLAIVPYLLVRGLVTRIATKAASR